MAKASMGSMARRQGRGRAVMEARLGGWVAAHSLLKGITLLMGVSVGLGYSTLAGGENQDEGCHLWRYARNEDQWQAWQGVGGCGGSWTASTALKWKRVMVPQTHRGFWVVDLKERIRGRQGALRSSV